MHIFGQLIARLGPPLQQQSYPRLQHHESGPSYASNMYTFYERGEDDEL